MVNRRLIIVLVGIILLVIIAGVTAGGRGQLSWPERFVKDSVSFLQQMIYKPVDAVIGFFEDVQNLYYLYEENKTLKSTLNQFSQLQAGYELLQKENQRLREMLDAKSTLSDYNLIVSEVIARQHDTWFNVFTINKGEREGVQTDMAVATSKGLVGMVESVSYFSSNVRLLTDIERGSHISAMVLGDEDTYGIIESYDVERKELVLRKVPLESKLELGQKVVTSGLGGVFPKGLLIGEVSEVLPGEDGLTKMAYIKPAADLYHIDEVFVVSRKDMQATDLGYSSTDGSKEGEGSTP